MDGAFMTAPIADPKVRKLREVRDLASLTEYLRDELEWPIADWDLEDLTFEYTAEEAGLDAQSALKVNSIRRLRPLSNDAPWGIFFIDFVPGDLPVTVLRRILRAMVVRKRAAGRPDRQAWQMDDLLFISALGPDGNRDINLARFNEDPEAKVPTLRVVEWDEADTTFHMLRTAGELRQLAWRAPGETNADWRERWAGAFTLKSREPVTTAKDLAAKMASLAARIRARVNLAMAVESENGPLRKLFKAFKEVLLHDLTEDGFADMYAQTITYGMFAARRSRPMGISLENAKDMVPSTNPFLRDLLAQFTDAAGLTQSLDFDELGVDALIVTLNAANVDAIVDDWGRNRPGEDLVIHFYEDFLKLYDKKQKVQRGVFYTPRPVVSFIVRSVHELLQTEFLLPDGLASTETWGDMQKKFPDLKIPEGTTPVTPFVQVLDPAVGTGTFLVEVIDVIYRTMTAKWQKQGFKPMFDFERLWNEYVPAHLLPRIYGYELMMASYTICHMKVGLKLDELGYRFPLTEEGADERLHIYLTNSLEAPQDFSGQFDIMAPALAHEARAVNAVKRGVRFTVVIGNPPYSRSSDNNGAYVLACLDRYKRDVRSLRNIQPLSDDYIKFWCVSQRRLNESGTGVIGLITNNSFLSGTIHRGMREALRADFSRIEIVDLHGSGKVSLRDGATADDKNVFDIQQGVAVTLLCTAPAGSPPRIGYLAIAGSRAEKYGFLSDASVSSAPFSRLEPAGPHWLWVPYDQTHDSEYATYVGLPEVFGFHSVGGKPGDDNLLVSFSAEEVIPKLLSALESPVQGRTEAAHNLARRRRTSFDPRLVEQYAYRPFDVRYTYYDSDIWTRAVTALHRRVMGQPLLLVSKIVKDQSFAHVWVSRQFPDVIHLSAASSVNCYAFPCADDVGLDGQLSPNPKAFSHQPANSLSPRACLDWIYAVLHSGAYRLRYAEPLRYDFPRVPVASQRRLFDRLSEMGHKLVALHLVEFALSDEPGAPAEWPRYPRIARFVGADRTIAGFPSAEKAWKDGRVAINATSRFDGVPEDVWRFHIGGYQVCHKWLKDRRGRTISDEDVLHYAKIVTALHETIRIMGEIDEVIEAHGGWPGAFQTASEQAT
jgi:predicted helicase